MDSSGAQWSLLEHQVEEGEEALNNSNLIRWKARSTMVIPSWPQQQTLSSSKLFNSRYPIMCTWCFLYVGTVITVNSLSCLWQELYPPQAWRWLEEKFKIAPKRHEDENFGWYNIVLLLLSWKSVNSKLFRFHCFNYLTGPFASYVIVIESFF